MSRPATTRTKDTATRRQHTLSSRLEERLLSEIFGISAIAGLIVTVSIDSIDMLIVQRREG